TPSVRSRRRRRAPSTRFARKRWTCRSRSPRRSFSAISRKKTTTSSSLTPSGRSRPARGPTSQHDQPLSASGRRFLTVRRFVFLDLHAFVPKNQPLNLLRGQLVTDSIH